MTPPPDSIDKAYQALLITEIEVLTDNAADALIAGELRALSIMGLPINLNIINSRSVSATLGYRQDLERFGGSEVTVINDVGVPVRQFKPWLQDANHAYREKVGEVIQDSIRNGKGIRDTEKALDAVFLEQEHNARLVAFRETKMLYNKGTFDRFAHEQVQQGVWHHMMPQPDPREEHQELDGKVFDLDDPVWYLLDEPNCHCWCEPVIIGGHTAVD